MTQTIPEITEKYRYKNTDKIIYPYMKELYNRSRTLFLFMLTYALAISSFAQTNSKSYGIGTDAPNPRAVLELNVANPSTYPQGLLLPRLTTTQRASLGTSLGSLTSVAGMSVYDTDLKSFYIWNGTSWDFLGSILTSITGANGITVNQTGNAFTIDGSNIATPFAPVSSSQIYTNSFVGIGNIVNPVFKLDVSAGSNVTHAKFGEINPVYLYSANPGIGFNAYWDGSNYIYGAGSSVQYGGVFGFNVGNGTFDFLISNTSGADGGIITTNNPVKITDNGIGIGNGVVPNEKLTVQGNSSVTGIGYFNAITISNLSGASGSVVTVDGLGNLGIGPLTSGSGGYTSANLTLPLYDSAGSLAISQVSGSSDGYLSSGDYTTFSNYGASITTLQGQISSLPPQTTISATNSNNINLTGGAGAYNIDLATIGGDISGNYNNLQVDKIKGYSVVLSSPAAGDVLSFDGVNFINAPGSSGGSSQWVGSSNIYYTSGNVGIGTTTPPSLLSAGSANGFQVDNNGNIIMLNGASVSFPNSNSLGYLLNNGSGVISWVPPGSVSGAGIGSLPSGTYPLVTYENATTINPVSASNGIAIDWNSTNKTLVMNNNSILLRYDSDVNHRLADDATMNGPILYGYGGGGFAVSQGSPVGYALYWKDKGGYPFNAGDAQIAINNNNFYDVTATLDVNGEVRIRSLPNTVTGTVMLVADALGNLGSAPISGGGITFTAGSGSVPLVGYTNSSTLNSLAISYNIDNYWLNMNAQDILLGGTDDRNHGLGFYIGTTKYYAGNDINGPVLYGNEGGGLGINNASVPLNLALAWRNFSKQVNQNFVSINNNDYNDITATLDVNGDVRIRSLSVLGTGGMVTVDGLGNLGSAALPSGTSQWVTSGTGISYNSGTVTVGEGLNYGSNPVFLVKGQFNAAMTIQRGSDSNASDLMFQDAGGNIQWQQSFRGTNNKFIIASSGFTPTFSIQPNGYIGIGFAESIDVNQKLTVNGNSSVTGTGYFGTIVGTNLTGAAGSVVTVDGTGKLGIAVYPSSGSSQWTINGSNLQPIANNDINISSTSGVYRIGGWEVLRGNTNNSVMLGGAGSDVVTGQYNNYIGYQAGQNSTVVGSHDNNFIGYQAGQNTIGENNNFIGRQAGQFNTAGYFNNFVGIYAGQNNTSGIENNFIGVNAGANNAGGSQNNFIGRNAGVNSINTNYNNFLGYNAGSATGDYNNFFGHNAGNNNNGYYNVAIGYKADIAPGYSNSIAIGANATASGSNIMALGGTGANAVKVGIGTSAPAATLHVVGGARIANLSVLGAGAIVTVDGLGNLGVGTMSSSGLSGSGSAGGLAYYTGANTLTSNGTNLNWNGTFVGINGIQMYVGSNNNFVIGNNSAVTGFSNVILGNYAGSSNTSGSQNNFIGSYAGQNNASGQFNNFVGNSAGNANTTGSYNNFTGYLTGYSNSTGNRNDFMGYRAGFGNSGGSYNVAIGFQADFNSGSLTNSIAIGKNATVFNSNTMALGGTGVDAISVGIGTGAPTAKLHVAGGARIESLSVLGTGAMVTVDGLGNLGVGALPPSGITLAAPGTNTLTGIAYATGSSTISFAGSSLQWDNANGRLYIGQLPSISNQIKFGIVSDQGDANMFLYNVSSSNSAGYLVLGRAKNNLSAPTAVLSGDQMGGIGFVGYDGTGVLTNGPQASIEAQAAENFTASANGARLAFKTTAKGTTNGTTRMSIEDNGTVFVGTSGSVRPNAVLQINSGGTMGLILPTVTQAQKTTMASSLTGADIGMIVYDVSNKFVDQWDGSGWSGQSSSNTSWSIFGTSITGYLATTTSGFRIGTQNNYPFGIEVNNQIVMNFATVGGVTIGMSNNTTPSALQVNGDLGLGDGTNTGNKPVVIWLTNYNTTGNTGDIVVVGTADNTFQQATVSSDNSVIGVLIEPCNQNTTPCRVAISGVVSVNITGTITRGQHCVASGGTAGTATSAALPSVGASIGVFLEGGTGTSKKVLLR